MAKLRHLAIVVKDMEESARFYEKVFEMKRAFEVKDRAIYLTDGLMNLAVLAYANTNRPGAQTADGRHGIHHFGFRVEDFKEIEAALEAAGATYAFDLGDPKGMNYERKWRDPEGILFDVSEKGWYGALDEAVAAKAQEKEPALS
jgi:catechol 2,3-dioxygenase-like lactoylglutathione lyase family enzyme